MTGLIIRGAAAGVAAGSVVGVGLALAGTWVIASYLYGVRLADPLVSGVVVIGLGVMTTVASWVPARRVGRVKVIDTLGTD